MLLPCVLRIQMDEFSLRHSEIQGSKNVFSPPLLSPPSSSVSLHLLAMPAFSLSAAGHWQSHTYIGISAYAWRKRRERVSQEESRKELFQENHRHKGLEAGNSWCSQGWESILGWSKQEERQRAVKEEAGKWMGARSWAALRSPEGDGKLFSVQWETIKGLKQGSDIFRFMLKDHSGSKVHNLRMWSGGVRQNYLPLRKTFGSGGIYLGYYWAEAGNAKYSEMSRTAWAMRSQQWTVIIWCSKCQYHSAC